jgi:GNAT superfamily N-acetyltransferase
MEKFVAGINNPLYRQDLGQALSGGRGAFRRFKDALKSHGPLEKLWYSFKEREMRQTVREWLQSSEEAKNLAAIGPEPDETEELVLIDFPVTVETFEGVLDEALIVACYDEAFPPEQQRLRELFGEECMLSLENGEELIRILIRTPGGDFAAMAMMARFDSAAGPVLKLPLLYVDVQFRGLGLAKLLIERAAEEAGKREIASLVVEIPGGGSVLLPFLEQAGFSTVRRSCCLKVQL